MNSDVKVTFAGVPRGRWSFPRAWACVRARRIVCDGAGVLAHSPAPHILIPLGANAVPQNPGITPTFRHLSSHILLAVSSEHAWDQFISPTDASCLPAVLLPLVAPAQQPEGNLKKK